MSTKDFDNIIDKLQTILVYITIFLTTISILALMLFDVFAGSLSMMFMTNNQVWLSLGISLATTGLLMSLMVASQNMEHNMPVFVAAFVVYVFDIVFDSLGADFMRYGNVGGWDVDGLQWMFRGLIGGISSVGDGIAFAIIVGMPIVKDILRKALPKQKAWNPTSQPSYRTPSQAPNYQTKKSDWKPSHRPNFERNPAWTDKSKTGRPEPTYRNPLAYEEPDF